MRLGDRGKTYGAKEEAPVGTLKKVRISDVVAEDRTQAVYVNYKNTRPSESPEITDKERAKVVPIMITGIPEHYVELGSIQ